MIERKSVILIVDDDPGTVHDLGNMLANDYEVICSTDGVDALQLAIEFLPDIILLDVMMPHPDGYAVCTCLKGTPKTRDIPTIFITARNDIESETRGLDCGAVDFIAKPVSPAVVRARVRNHLARRRSEETLSATARRLIEAEELAHVAAWEWDIVADRFHLSDEWLRIHGCDNPKISWEEMMAFVHPDDQEHMSAMFLDGSAGLDRLDFQYRIIRRNDGSTRIVLSRRRMLRNAEDEPFRMLGATQDITEQKLAELELTRLKAAAEEASLAKSAFLANMSHELRTPLTSIIGFSEIIRDQYFGPVGTQAYAEYAKDINDSGHHLLNLISDILDLAKIESGKMTISPVDIETRSCLIKINRLVSQRAVRQKLDLISKMSDDVPNLWADERAFKQIIYNLLSNAIKFTPEKGRVALEAEAGRDGGVIIRVVDSGIGIPAKDLARVLQPFEQIENSYSRSRGGTGLGLSLVKGLIELHGGTLNIDSCHGIGTTVCVWFPAKPSQSQGLRE